MPLLKYSQASKIPSYLKASQPFDLSRTSNDLMRPTHIREVNQLYSVHQFNVKFIQNTFPETLRIMFDQISGWAPCGPLKLTH